MANVNVGDTIRAVCRMRDSHNSVIENVYWWKHAGTAQADDATLLGNLETSMSTIYGYFDGYMPTSLQPVDIIVDIVQWAAGKLVTVGNVGTVAWTTWGGGISAAEILPEGIAAQINFPTNIPHTQGRKYLGTLTETANSNGLIAGGPLLAMVNFAAPFLSNFSFDTQAFTPGVMSKKALDLVAFNTYVIPAYFSYQRRRKPGVGI